MALAIHDQGDGRDIDFCAIYFGVRDNFGCVKRDEWISEGPFVSFSVGRWARERNIGKEERKSGRAPESGLIIDFGRATKDSSRH